MTGRGPGGRGRGLCWIEGDDRTQPIAPKGIRLHLPALNSGEKTSYGLDMEIEVAPGHIWTIWFEWADGEPEPMAAAAQSAEKALKEAHYSLSGADVDYTIIGLLRNDKLTGASSKEIAITTQARPC
jgi:hypothetical protein